MKINQIQHYLTPNSGSTALPQTPESFKERYYADVYKKDRGYNAHNSGRLQNESKSAAVAFQGNLGHRILKSEKFSWFLEKAHEHNIAMSAFMALLLAGICRPATIMALPGDKDKDDKIYASGHSIASGVIGFIASVILTSPLDIAIKKYTDLKNANLWKKDGPYKAMIDELKKLNAENADEALIKLQEGKISAMKTAMKNIPDWIIAVPRSMITIALIPPILKYVFGVEKKKKPDAAPEPEKQAERSQMPMNLQNNPAFAMMKGGLK